MFQYATLDQDHEVYLVSEYNWRSGSLCVTFSKLISFLYDSYLPKLLFHNVKFSKQGFFSYKTSTLLLVVK